MSGGFEQRRSKKASTDRTKEKASARRTTFGPTQAKDHLRRSGGRPLDASLRQEFEPLLGVDLSAVTVHDDPHGRAAARGLGVPAVVHRAQIAFAGAAPSWRSGAGRKLWAHELAHAAQFLSTGEVGSPDELNRHGDSAESEARRAANALIRGERYVPLSRPTSEFQPFLGDAADWVVDTAGDAADYVGDRVEDAVEWTAEQLRELIPDEILELFEDVTNVVQTWIEEGFASWLEDFLSQVSFVDAIEPFFKAIGSYAADFDSFGTSISETAGEALSPLFEPIVNALSEWINPALEAQIANLESEQQAQEEIDKELFQKDAKSIQGVVDAIRDGVDAVWETITDFLSSIPGAEEAWEWLMDTLGVMLETAEEIIDWIMEQVSELWDWISEAIEPIKPALEILAKVLFILSPLGPIYILMEYGPQLWEYLTEWFADFDLTTILTERLDAFTEDVLPFLKDTLRTAAGALATGIALVVPVIDALIAGAEQLGGLEIEWLAVLRVWLDWVASEAQKFAALTDEQIKAMMDAAMAAFEALIAFLGKLLDFFVRLLMVAVNPWLLPVAITGVLWLLLPDAFKPPIIDFILNIIILAAMAFPDELFGLGPLGPVIKAAIVAFFISLKQGGNLDEVPEPRRSDAATQRKIDASNKIAAIAAGGGVLFVAGYLVGLLEGLWTGLSDPFVLIWDLLSFVFTAVTKLLEFVHQMGEGLFEEGGAAASEAMRTDPDLRADMAADEQAALDEVMRETAAEASAEREGSMPSEETVDELRASAEAGENVEQEFEQSRDEASSTQSIDVERIMNWLWSVRTRLREGAASLGRSLAEAFFDFIEKPDFELGRSIGNVMGQLLFEIILGILTAGGWTALSVAKPFIKAGAKIAKMLKRTIRPLIRLIRRLRGPVSRGLGAIGDVLRQIPGMRGIIDRIEDAMRRMMRYVDEYDAPPRRTAGSTPDASPGTQRRPRDRDGDSDGARQGDRDQDSRRDHDDPDARRRHDDEDPDSRRHRDDDADPDDDSPAGRQRRLVAARRAIRHRFRRGMLETRARSEAQRIALRYRVRASLNEVGPRYRLRLRINPALDSFFAKADLDEVKRRAQAQGISLRSLQERLTEMWRTARDRSREEGVRAREAAAYQRFNEIFEDPSDILEHPAVQPHLRSRHSGAGAGDRFEEHVRAGMGPEVIPRTSRGGFDVERVGDRIDITEVKRGTMRASTTRSSANSQTIIARGKTFPIDSSRGGSPIAAHLSDARQAGTVGESAERILTSKSHPTADRGSGPRVVENQLSAITTNFALNLADMQRRYVAMQADAHGADIESVEERMQAANVRFNELLRRGEIVVRLALNVENNASLLNQIAGGDHSNVELQAAISLLERAIAQFRGPAKTYGAKVRLVVASVSVDDEGVAEIGPDIDVARF